MNNQIKFVASHIAFHCDNIREVKSFLRSEGWYPLYPSLKHDEQVHKETPGIFSFKDDGSGVYLEMSFDDDSPVYGWTFERHLKNDIDHKNNKDFIKALIDFEKN